MPPIEAFLLGILQGLTEFLPVSSSGHLVLAQELLGINLPGLSFELVVHVGTLVAVLIYFRSRFIDLIRSLFDSSRTRERKLILCIIVGTIPAGLVGLLLKDNIEAAFASPLVTSVMLMVTGLILLAPRLVSQGEREVGFVSAILIGVAQSFAILPGISRSGSTISAGLMQKIDPERAAEFSFLLAVPAIAGAVVLKFDEFSTLEPSLYWPYAVGFIGSLLAGLFAVYAVMALIKQGRFQYFAFYCLAVGAIGVYLFV